MLLAQDDEGSGSAEGVAAVGLQARHSAEAALPVLTPGGRKERRRKKKRCFAHSEGVIQGGSVLAVLSSPDELVF